jgi:uncharacterized protein YqeY
MIKEKIQTDFINAMKSKDEIAKIALSGIKAKITEAEKANGNRELTDDEIIRVITKAIKQREESARIYSEAGRPEMAAKELLEINVLSDYMPAKMTDEEIESELRKIVGGFSEVITNPQALSGKTIGEFNKRFNGRADIAKVKSTVERIVNGF